MLSNAVLLDERVTFLSSSEGWTVTHAHGAKRSPPPNLTSVSPVMPA